jgi:hypothetical protein
MLSTMFVTLFDNILLMYFVHYHYNKINKYIK